MDDKIIRFIDTQYNELFRIPDGGYVQIEYPDGNTKIRQCHYNDATHTIVGTTLYHIHQIADSLEKAGGTVAPVAKPETVHGYMITDRTYIGDISIVLAHNPSAVQPYVTWQGHRQHEGYDWGHYYSKRMDAERDFFLRADAQRTGAPYEPYRPERQNRDDAR